MTQRTHWIGLNVIWSFIFLGHHRPGWAFFEIILLWIAILATMIWFFQRSFFAGWLLLPYLAGVSFALSVFRLLGPDGKQQEFQQILRTAKGTLLAMGPVLLHSTNEGQTWTSIDGFPAVPDKRDNAEGRYLTRIEKAFTFGR